MARSTFEGPILAGTNRFPPFRNVGSVGLQQTGSLGFTNSPASSGGAQFSGGSGTAVTGGQTYPNTQAIVYTPNSSSTTLTPALTTADTTSVFYRTFVMYVPTGSTITGYYVAVGDIPVFTTGTVSGVTVSLSNQYAYNGAFGATYAITNSLTAAGLATWATLTKTQVRNQQSTSTDIVLPNGQFNVSQIVWTVAVNGSSLAGPINSGDIWLGLTYVQSDPNVGSATAYPYGNFD